MKSDPFFNTHVHSRFSSSDALPEVEQLVLRAKRFGQSAMGLTDHGNMSGTVELYLAGKKHGIQVMPGLEGYLVEDVAVKAAPRFHIGFLSLNFPGYQALTELSSASQLRENFLRFPRFDFAMLASLSEDPRSDGLAILTGCYFGLVQQTLVSKGYAAAKRVVQMYARWFPNTFVEIQNHNIDHTETNPSTASEFKEDSDICDAMVRIANESGLPLIVTQDSHYLDEMDKSAHTIMKNMVYVHSKMQTNEFPGDSFHFASAQWVKEHHDPSHWRQAQESYGLLLEKHELELPALDGKFKAHIPTASRTPKKDLRRAVNKGLSALEAKGLLQRTRVAYDKQLAHELEIINFLGMAGYFMIWVEIVGWLERNKIAHEARGSANGSLVCYLLGITSIDPLEHGLLFERFLSKDRKEPPDIDMDVEDISRQDVVGMLQGRFGVQQIGTFGSLGAREDDDKGSVLVSYNSYMRAKMGPPNFSFRFGKGFETIRQVQEHSRKDYQGLRRLSRYNATRSYGVHASGLLLNGDDLKISEYIPTMLVPSSGKVVTQFTQDDVAKLGLLKLDLLGQRTLTAMKKCQQYILDGCADGTYMQSQIGIGDDPSDFSWIPKDDRETCAAIRVGRPKNGVFQFEGWSMANGARQLGVKSTNDCILAGALFRPACMASGMTDLYIRRRKNPAEKKGLIYPHPAFERILKSTNGIVLFQEQVLEIMRALGLDYEGINTFFKIVKDSGKGATGRNLERAAEVKARWQKICDDNDITDPEGAWHYIEGYTQYGFNKAHSAGYGLRSYRAQYLKTHFPAEYMAATLWTVAGKPKERDYMAEARFIGVRILPPDVNTSGEYWTLDRKKNAVRKGLLSVVSVGPATAREIAEKAPYTSVEDLVARVTPRLLRGGRDFKLRGEYAGALYELREAGALMSLGVARSGY